ncbi:MAG: polysaccharide biosynthesis/export family protein [Muribaculaceae bacterium]|nr:polysaccharide biosynthesis/export family protein [Muribaculaceae bacterium]
MKKLAFLFAIATALCVTSCSSPKKVAYIQKVDEIPVEVLQQIPAPSDPTLMPGDLLNIELQGSDFTALAPFNKGTGMYLDADGKIVTSQSNRGNINNTSSESNTMYYLVNADGYIDFPMLGMLHVAGMTKSQLAQEILNGVYPRFVKDKPSVDVRLMNFRVTLLGAVKTNGQVQSKNERMNILEAIALAGDLDIQAQRENVLLYRLNADGTREIHRIDLTDKNLLLSPYYNLQQNDIIYVEPNQSMKNRSWTLNPAVGAVLTIVGGLSSIAGLVISIITLTRL